MRLVSFKLGKEILEEINQLVIDKKYTHRSQFIRTAIRQLLESEFDSCPYCKLLLLNSEPHYCQDEGTCALSRLYSHIFNDKRRVFTNKVYTYSVFKCLKCETLKIQKFE